MKNWIASWFASMAAGKLSGYKTILFALATILSVVVAVIGHLYPEYGLPGSNLDWAVLLKQAQGAWAILVPVAGIGVGASHKFYKLGVDTDKDNIADLTAMLSIAAGNKPAPVPVLNATAPAVIEEPMKLADTAGEGQVQ
jgi:hypothetical protein